MISLTPEQRLYKEQTLTQLLTDQAQLETILDKETDPRAAKSLQRQLTAIETHISRLQDELAGNVVFDEPVAEELFKKAASALAKEKFYLANRHIKRLETIEPFYPGLERMKQETESQQVSRRTRSIAEGKSTNYPGVTPLQSIPAGLPGLPPEQAAAVFSSPNLLADAPDDEEPKSWYSYFFQFHVLLSCLVVMLLLCVVFGMAGATILQWLFEGGV